MANTEPDDITLKVPRDLVPAMQEAARRLSRGGVHVRPSQVAVAAIRRGFPSVEIEIEGTSIA